MKNNIEIHSLRPYLEPDGAKFYLKFSWCYENATAQGKSRFPFLVINESDPLARLIEAQFVSDAGSEIRRVFILLQNDEYLLPRDELWPVNNKDIDQWWQRAFSSYSRKNQNSSVVVLADQISKDGGLSPLQPLFFCKPKQIFFHPPCPKCGFSLQQCYDDDILISLGLQPYSTSLKRYLFCPSCFGSAGKSDFYVFALESSDPPILKDRWDLIRECGLLAEGKNHLGQFPCPECANRHECYGSDGLAVTTIAPFSFYPFFMLIFEAMSVNAVDFLSLVSGASLEDLESHLGEKQQLGRISCLKALRRNGLVKAPFLFDSDERCFLEVLYLKLSFLGELMRTILHRLDVHKYPDMGLSIDRVWVKLPDQGGLLPLFWNFKVDLIDIGGNAVKTPFFPKLPPSHSLHFLGLVWFYTLLVNKKQGVSEVYVALGEAIEEVASNNDSTFENLINNGFNRAFFPENIFWNPEGQKEKSVGKNWGHLWEESMGLGWSLLRGSLSQDFQWSKDEFWQKLESLREEIKDNLFQQSPTVGQAEPAPENKAIHEVLVRIMNKWRTDFEAEKDELGKTVVLSKEASEDLEKTVVLSKEAAEELDKTVVLSPQEAEEQEIQETVILSPEDFRKDASHPARVEEDDIPETVVIAPSDKTRAFSRSSEELPPRDVAFEKEEGPLRQKLQKPEDDKKRIDGPASDDFLAETVILSPDKTKDKG